MERVKGIEPSSSAWKAVALPLSYTRTRRTANRRQRAEVFVRFYRPNGGGGRTRTYEGVSQRIYRFQSPLDITQEFSRMSRLCRMDRSPLAVQERNPAGGLRSSRQQRPCRRSELGAIVAAREQVAVTIERHQDRRMP